MPPFVGLVRDIPGKWRPASQCEVDGLEGLKVPVCIEEADNPLRASFFIIHSCASPKIAIAAGFYSPGGVALLHQVKLATSALPRFFPSGWWASTTNASKDFTNKIVQETKPELGPRDPTLRLAPDAKTKRLKSLSAKIFAF